ncbi:YolD-like family protein [Bacillus cereus group sp. BfR-BA-01310]
MAILDEQQLEEINAVVYLAMSKNLEVSIFYHKQKKNTIGNRLYSLL